MPLLKRFLKFLSLLTLFVAGINTIFFGNIYCDDTNIFGEDGLRNEIIQIDERISKMNTIPDKELDDYKNSIKSELSKFENYFNYGTPLLRILDNSTPFRAFLANHSFYPPKIEYVGPYMQSADLRSAIIKRKQDINAFKKKSVIDEEISGEITGLIRGSKPTIGYPSLKHTAEHGLGKFVAGHAFLLTVDASSLIDVIPDNFAEQLSTKLQLKDAGLNAKQRLLKAIKAKTINLTFYVILWQNNPDINVWASDRNYNLRFDDVLKGWPTAKGDLQVGLFGANGIGLAKRLEPIPLNIFSKYNPVGHIQLESNRKIGNFWSAIISENNKNLVITFNTIIDDVNISVPIFGSSLKYAKDKKIENVLTAIGKSINALKNEASDFTKTGELEKAQKATYDVDALKQTDLLLRKIHKISDEPEPKEPTDVPDPNIDLFG